LTDTPRAAGRQAAAIYLRQLLTQHGRYRRLWEKHVLRSRPGEITQLAVAEVLAEYLWSNPRESGHADVLPRQIKDTVARALSGTVLSRPTLELFIGAFMISESHAERLWRLWEGSPRISILSGREAVGAKTLDDMRAALGPPGHQSVSMHDHVSVGSDGRVAKNRTLQVVEATVDGLDRIPYLYDTSALALEVLQGCGEVSGDLYEISDGLYATTIPLAKTLAIGETISLEYITTYSYPGNLDDPQEREFRRAAMRRLENLDMRVEFHPDMLPAHVWWVVWEGLAGGIIEREPVTLGAQHEVHRYLRSVEKIVVGFRWSWNDDY
jgi:hypothetical protein